MSLITSYEAFLKTGKITADTAQFAVLQIRFYRLDWLHLGREGQRRADFIWRDDVLEQRWVTP